MMGEDWIRIQETTFRNWCNEQLKVSGRAVSNLVTDLCDGVCLVALVEALQVGSQLCEDLPPLYVMDFSCLPFGRFHCQF